MNSNAAWHLFLNTGAPEAYLLYNQLRKMEDDYVPDGPGVSDPGYRIQ